MATFLYKFKHFISHYFNYKYLIILKFLSLKYSLRIQWSKLVLAQIVDFTLHYTKLVFLKTEMIIQWKLRKSSYRGFWGFALLSTKSATTFGKLKFKFCVLKHKYRNIAGYWLKERRTWKLWRNDIANSRWRDVQSEQQSHARVIRTFVRLSDQILSNIFQKQCLPLVLEQHEYVFHGFVPIDSSIFFFQGHQITLRDDTSSHNIEQLSLWKTLPCGMNWHEYGLEIQANHWQNVTAWWQILSSHAFQPINHKTGEMNTIVWTHKLFIVYSYFCTCKLDAWI